MSKPTIIHNETCPICSREVAHYAASAERAGLPLEVEGLNGTARHRWGLTEEAAAKRFHVEQNGALVSGIDAFLIIWRHLPRLRWLAWLVSLPGVYQLAVKTYDYLLAPALFAFHKRRMRRKTRARP